MAPSEVSKDLLRAHTVGKVACQESRARLDEDQQDKFHSKLKKQGLKTFANISIEHKSKKSRDIMFSRRTETYSVT